MRDTLDFLKLHHSITLCWCKEAAAVGVPVLFGAMPIVLTNVRDDR